jgi:prolyl oligopeptidase
MENGGVYAVPNRRRRIWKKWHDAGTKMQKQNVFDDFIAAAEYLIAQKILLPFLPFVVGQMEVYVGATMTQRQN